MIASVTLR